MRAAVLTRFGGPDAVELRDVPDPRPGPGEVRVRVAAAATNNTDLWTREGTYGTDEPGGWLGPLDFPRIQGGDVAGRVVGLGAGATIPFLNVYIEGKFDVNYASLGNLFAWTSLATAATRPRR